MAPASRQRLGEAGEDAACAALARLGYEILARRYRVRHGEIDIIARDNGVIVFVEVKARVDHRFGGPAAAVTAWKQRRLAGIALHFLARHRLQDHPCRFDVVTVEFTGGAPLVQVYRDAFST
jgi:putative endonuclease